MRKIIEKNPLYFAFLLPAIVDGVITIVGQGESYWRSTDKVINEASPAYFFLAVSPWLFLLGSLVWFVGWYWIFLKLPEKFKLFFVFLFIAAHSWGTGSWFVKILRDQGWWSLSNIYLTNALWGALVVYFAVIAIVATYCLNVYIHKLSSKITV